MFRSASAGQPLRTWHCFAGTPPAPLERPPYDTAFGDDNHGYCLEPAFGHSVGWTVVASDGCAAITVGPVQTQEGAVLGLIRRWNERGRPDRHFGHTGDRLEAFGFEEARASRAVMDRESRQLFVAGHSWRSFPNAIGLTRIDARSGSADLGFGGDGVVQVSVGNHRGPFDVTEVDAIAWDPATRRLFLSFYATDVEEVEHSGVLCRNADGTVGSSFGPDGLFAVATMSPAAPFQHLAVDSSSRLVAAGTLRLKDGTALVVSRMRPDGEPDPDFGSDGKVFLKGLPGVRAASVQVDREDRILVVGDTQDPTSIRRELFALRLNPQGRVDPSFGAAGWFRGCFAGFGIQSSAASTAATLDSEGRLLVTGESDTFREPGWIGLLRLTPNGLRDTSFAGLGTARFDLHRHRHRIGSRSVTTDATGRILLAGLVQDLPQSDSEGLLLRAVDR